MTSNRLELRKRLNQEWVGKHRVVYTQKDGNHIVHFLLPNEIDNYNYLMMSVDIMDKGRSAYKPYRFLSPV